MKNKILYTAISGFVCGIFVRSFFEINIFWLALFPCIFISIFCAASIWRGSIIFRLELIALFSVLILFGVLRFDLKDQKLYDVAIDSTIEQSTVSEALIITEPDVRDENVRMVVQVENLKIGIRSEDVSAKILITVPLFPKYEYGDRVQLSGKILLPAWSEDFDYRAYLKKDGIGYVMYQPKVKILSRDQGNYFVSSLLSVKRFFVAQIQEVLPEPESSLLSGLLLGGKSSLGAGVQNDFRNAGIIHIVVLSGYNITIVAENVMKIFSFFSRSVGFFFWKPWHNFICNYDGRGGHGHPCIYYGTTFSPSSCDRKSI